MKTILIIVFLTVAVIAQSNEHAIYFDDLESVTFEIDQPIEILTFTLTNGEIITKFIFFKRGDDDYVFTTMDNGVESKLIPLKESGVRSLMPAIIKHFVDKHDVSIEEMNKVINLIY